jgi:hypothetical protein
VATDLAIEELEPEEEELPPQEPDTESDESASELWETLLAEYDTDERRDHILHDVILAIKNWQAGDSTCDDVTSAIKALESSLPVPDTDDYKAVQADILERLYAAAASSQLAELAFPLLQLSRDLEDNNEEP